MKIIIFIIIACTLFVAWSLCIVGASADEQLEMIYAKDLERKENSMDNTYAPTENKEQEKIKVPRWCWWRARNTPLWSSGSTKL